MPGTCLRCRSQTNRRGDAKPQHVPDDPSAKTRATATRTAITVQDPKRTDLPPQSGSQPVVPRPLVSPQFIKPCATSPKGTNLEQE